MNRDSGMRLDESNGLHSLFSVHREQHAKEPGSTEMQEGQINLRVAMRDRLQLFAHQGIARDIQTEDRTAWGPLKFEHTAHDWWKHTFEGTGSMLRRHGGDVQVTLAFFQGKRFPGIERVGKTKFLFPESRRGLRSSYNRHILLQLARYTPVKVILVHMGEHHTIKPGQRVHFERWIG